LSIHKTVSGIQFLKYAAFAEHFCPD